MKATVKENETFKPITIELVIESEQELCNLYRRLHLNSGTVNECSGALIYMADSSDAVLFKIIKDKVKQFNLYK